jgi:hypothetical protein
MNSFDSKKMSVSIKTCSVLQVTYGILILNYLATPANALDCVNPEIIGIAGH